MNTEQIQNILSDWALWAGICSKPPSLEQISPLVKGLTNDNFLLSTTNNNTTKRFVIRINAPNAHALFLNRHAEWHIHQSIAQYGICPQYVYRDPKDRYWIRPYTEQKTLNETLLDSKNTDLDKLLTSIVNKLKITHQVPISNAWPRINFLERTDHYWNQIFKKFSHTEQLNTLKNLKDEADKQLKSTGYTPTLCHMDPNPNNWIINNHEAILIDWEYAAIGNPAWDLATLINTCNLSEDDQNKLLTLYFNGRIKKSQIEFAKCQMEYLSALWYCVQGILNPVNLVDVIREQIEAIPVKHTQKSRYTPA